jgi:hypothetical protein
MLGFMVRGIVPGDGIVGKVVFPRSSIFIILMTNRHRLRVANGYIWRGMQNTDRLWKSIVGCATA